MIKSIKISNFCSIGQTQEVCFDISSKDVLNESAIQIDQSNINLVNCFIGANASGKTNVLKAISFLFWLSANSYTSVQEGDDFSVSPHQLHKNNPVSMQIEFFIGNDIYKHIIEYHHNRISHEYLGKKVIKGFTRIFEYTRSQNSWNFKKSNIQINANDLKRFEHRENVSALSSLIATGYLPELDGIKHFSTNVTHLGMRTDHPLDILLNASKNLYHNEDLRQKVLKLTIDADLGLSDFKFKTLENPKASSEAEKIHVLECIHQSHKHPFQLPFFEESNGTRNIIHILSDIIPILESGGIVILDEIESGLHPDAVRKIISLFESKEINQKNAQLLFSTHQHVLLNDRTKTQIFITQKDDKTLETEVFRLDDVEGIRNDENYFNKYATGAYGGTPHIKWM